MRIVFGADDENGCTRAVVEHLRGVADVSVLGGSSWPEFARDAGRAVAAGEADFGVLMCWNDANVLALSLKRLAPDVAVECVRAFLEVAAEDPEESASIDLIRNL